MLNGTAGVELINDGRGLFYVLAMNSYSADTEPFKGAREEVFL